MTTTPAFLITIDTEGDNLWSAPRDITTENARWLPRFQGLCEEFGFKPSYLTDYEMAACPAYQAFARDALRRDSCEVGMHLHAWNSPPIRALTADDYKFHPYLIEYPPELIEEKVQFMTRLLEETFERPVTSHRAGRWAFDSCYARTLARHGYRVDCSVTPGVSWTGSPGKPGGNGGSDYRDCQHQPYYVDFEDIRRPGESSLLELPVTIMRTCPPAVDGLRARVAPRSITARLLNRLFPPLTWLRPDGHNRGAMLRLLRQARADGRSFVEFILHSSELMPGGSPTFSGEGSIERLYADLRALFSAASRRFRAATLSEFAAEVATGRTEARREAGGRRP